MIVVGIVYLLPFSLIPWTDSSVYGYPSHTALRSRLRFRPQPFDVGNQTKTYRALDSYQKYNILKYFSFFLVSFFYVVAVSRCIGVLVVSNDGPGNVFFFF